MVKRFHCYKLTPRLVILALYLSFPLYEYLLSHIFFHLFVFRTWLNPWWCLYITNLHSMISLNYLNIQKSCDVISFLLVSAFYLTFSVVFSSFLFSSYMQFTNIVNVFFYKFPVVRTCLLLFIYSSRVFPIFIIIARIPTPRSHPAEHDLGHYFQWPTEALKEGVRVTNQII